ncbi:MAG: TetR/AcrR family transcriptional regulator, partial [Sulfurovum sp.]|nr:TetR/AcrR family transcriptional regulator [Sulfurovum sp.]MCB4774471.1 TetR/AcrR family transcriptional regulator [Sulfurovum sp.]
KNTYHHGNLKQELLSFSLDFIHKKDIDKLTLKILADVTNTSRSAIYKHFSSKDELIKAVMEKGFDKFDSVIVPILSNDNEDLDKRFFIAAKYYIDWAKKNPNLYRLLFGKKYAHVRESFITIRSENCKGFMALKALIEEGQMKRLIKIEDSFAQTVVVWSSLHGLTSLIINCFHDVEEIYDDLVNKMLYSLLTGLANN